MPTIKLLLSPEEARFLMELLGVTQYDCKQEVLGMAEDLFARVQAQLNKKAPEWL